MTAWLGRRRGPGVAVIVAATAVLAAGTRWSVSVTAQKPPLAVERLAALPTLIGTAPAAPVWSPDGTRLAFLRNDPAMPFHDVWVVDAGSGQPRKLTDLNGETRRLVAPSATQPIQDDLPMLMADAADRLRTGATEAVWTPDGRSLIVACEDRLYRVGADGGGSPRLELPPAGRTALAFSPNGRFLSWIQDGDLWLWNQETNGVSQATHAGVPAIGNIPGSAYTHPDAEFTLPKWSPDSRAVAMHWDDRRRVRKLLFPDYLGEQVRITELRRDFPGDNDQIRGVAIVSVDRGQVRTIDLPDATDRRNGSFSWSPDGARLLIDQNSEDAKDRWIYVVTLAGGTPEEVLHEQRPIAGTTTTASALWTAEWQSDEVDLAGRPSVNDEVFRRSSPVTYAKQLQDHLLIIHGMRDDNVLFKDSVLLTEKLMLLGKDFDFVLLPSSVHDAMRKDYVATFTLRKLVEHFDRYLGRGPTGGRPD